VSYHLPRGVRIPMAALTKLSSVPAMKRVPVIKENLCVACTGVSASKNMCACSKRI